MEAVSATAFRIEIENGHRITAFLGGKSRFGETRPLPGDRVALQVSPFDLSKGRIVGIVGKQDNL